MAAVILLIEDDFHVRELVRRYLAGQDCELVEASSRAEADRLLHGPRRIDIVLADILPRGTTALAECARAIAKEALLAEPFRQLALLNGIGKRLGHWAVGRNPVLGRAHDYWLQKSAGAAAPDRSMLDPRELIGILPHLSIVEIVEHGPARCHRYRLAGTRVVEALGYDPTASIAEERRGSDAEFLHKVLIEVAQTKQPAYAAGPLDGGETGRSTERLFLPFRRGGDAVRQFVIAQTFDWQRRRTIAQSLARAYPGPGDERRFLAPAAARPLAAQAIDAPAARH